MKSALVTIAGLSAVAFLQPESLTELASLACPVATDATDEDKAAATEKGLGRVFHAANQQFLQANLGTVRGKFVEKVAAKYGLKPSLTIGKVEVEAVLDDKGRIASYKSADGKKTFKKDSKTTAETDTAFLERVCTEKGITLEDLRPLCQEAANETTYDATQKRGAKGSVASKPVGKKWLALAEKIVKAGNQVATATRLAKEIGEAVDVTGEDKVNRLALAMAKAEQIRRTKSEAEFAKLGGVEEAPTVVDATK